MRNLLVDLAIAHRANIFGRNKLKTKSTKKPTKRKVWYTVDSPEVKQMTKGK